jgi:hypothetical protein
LIAGGYKIHFIVLQGVPHDRILEELSTADLSIGKMKMGYYANFQVESLMMGVPAVTWVRDEFMTDALRESGLILTDLAHLEETLRHLLDHPEALLLRKAVARSSVRRLHGNEQLSGWLADRYKALGGEAGLH